MEMRPNSGNLLTYEGVALALAGSPLLPGRWRRQAEKRDSVSLLAHVASHVDERMWYMDFVDATAVKTHQSPRFIDLAAFALIILPPSLD